MAITRRGFFKVGGAAAAGMGVAARLTDAEAAGMGNESGRATLPYKPKVIGAVSKLQNNVPVNFTFPDPSSPCVLVKLGAPVPGGAGPDGDIVAYSEMCTHNGCTVNYDAATKTFKCPCHFSIFDAEKDGQMVCGQATENLPRIVLNVSAKDGSVSAVSVEGLLYGRQSNLL